MDYLLLFYTHLITCNDYYSNDAVLFSTHDYVLDVYLYRSG